MNQDKQLVYEKKGPIAHIILNRPGKINAMTVELYDLLEAAVKDYTEDDSLSCAVVSGAGGNFSSGADLKEGARAGGSHYDGYGIFPPYRAMTLCPKPFIAAVDGYCIGSGFSCAVLYSDMCIASDRAVFGVAPQREFHGRSGTRWFSQSDKPRSGGYAKPYSRRMSPGNAFYIWMAVEKFSAQDALRMGIVSEVVHHGQLMERVSELATTISKIPIAEIKRRTEFLRLSLEVPGAFDQRLTDIIRW
ncbi:MAG: enoyl-CoA hydratase/isomerase family protein [Deltaproteobacteria bacterium]|nr:enoyl-CoA hydratase/isomerase family protein [Deltaproteobacteria bacterium]